MTTLINWYLLNIKDKDTFWAKQTKSATLTLASNVICIFSTSPYVLFFFIKQVCLMYKHIFHNNVSSLSYISYFSFFYWANIIFFSYIFVLYFVYVNMRPSFFFSTNFDQCCGRTYWPPHKIDIKTWLLQYCLATSKIILYLLVTQISVHWVYKQWCT